MIKPKMEDIEVDMELLQAELRFKPEKYRNGIMRKYAGGYSVRCHGIPSTKVSYQIGDGVLVEYYCEDCFDSRKEGRSKNDLDKLNLGS